MRKIAVLLLLIAFFAINAINAAGTEEFWPKSSSRVDTAYSTDNLTMMIFLHTICATQMGDTLFFNKGGQSYWTLAKNFTTSFYDTDLLEYQKASQGEAPSQFVESMRTYGVRTLWKGVDYTFCMPEISQMVINHMVNLGLVREQDFSHMTIVEIGLAIWRYLDRQQVYPVWVGNNKSGKSRLDSAGVE